MDIIAKNLETEIKGPYKYYRFKLVQDESYIFGHPMQVLEKGKKIDIVDLLKKRQKEKLGTLTQANIGRLLEGRFTIVNGDYGIWALGFQKNNRIKIMTKKDDGFSYNYLNQTLDI